MGRSPIKILDENTLWREDLCWLASRSLELGQEFCRCPGYYHILHGLFRASGFIRSLEKDRFILSSALDALPTAPSSVLIAGSADTGIVSTLMQMIGGLNLHVTVLDKCRAPLRLVDEFVTSKPNRCHTLLADIATLDGRQRWDLVLLHYTSMFFDSASRLRYFESLACSLEPKGFLICMDRLSLGDSGSCRAKREAAYFYQAHLALESSPIRHLWASTDLEHMLHHYARERANRRVNYPAVGEVENILEAIGLTIVFKSKTDRRTVLDPKDGEEVDAHMGSIVVAQAT